jgi:hypothetical protein
MSLRRLWKQLKALFKSKGTKTPQKRSNGRSWQPELYILKEEEQKSKKISRSRRSGEVQVKRYEEIPRQNIPNNNNNADIDIQNTIRYNGSETLNDMRADEINIGSGFKFDHLDSDYKPSIVRDEGNYSGNESYGRSLNRPKKKPTVAGHTLVQELERKKSIKRAALEPPRNPNVTTLVDVTPPNLIKKGTLLDSSVTLTRTKSRSIGSIKIVIDQASEGLIRSKSKKSRAPSAGLADSGLAYSSSFSNEYHSGKSIDHIRAATHLNNTSDESEERSFDLQRKFLASTSGLTRKNTGSLKQSADLTRTKSRRTVREHSLEEPQIVSRKKSVKRNPLDAHIDTTDLTRSKSIRNGESLSRRKSRKPRPKPVVSSSDDDVPLGLSLQRSLTLQRSK